MGDGHRHGARRRANTCMHAGDHRNGDNAVLKKTVMAFAFALTLGTATTAGGALASTTPDDSEPAGSDAPAETIAIPDLSAYTIGFAQVGAESGWRTANTQSIQAAADAAGVELLFTDAQGRQEAQVESIRGFIEQGVDLIAFSPIVETGWDAVLIEARDAGIPVILTD